MPLVTQNFTQNRARTLRLGVIVILSFQKYLKSKLKFSKIKTNSACQGFLQSVKPREAQKIPRKIPFSPPSIGIYMTII